MVVPTKLLALFILLAICYARTEAVETGSYECSVCEEQLAKYRKFILQAIINFEDVCDSYRPDNSGHDFLHSYQPKERGDIWAFFKLLMAQFNDVDFVNVVHDAVIDRCRTRFQREEKRDPTMLGKKQRFHSWGGKRALPLQQQPSIDLNNRILDEKTSDKQYFI